VALNVGTRCVSQTGSVAPEVVSVAAAKVYSNKDGMRYNDGRYDAFAEDLDSVVPKARQFTDPVHTFAYGTDASFYRLNPKMVRARARCLPLTSGAACGSNGAHY